MASFFRGPVQSTPFQQAIEKVTDGNQPNEDWALIMRICDHIVLHEERYFSIFLFNFQINFSFD
jgi:hypothetical protein